MVRQRLEEAGLIIASIEPEGAVIAFREDADLTEFRTAVAAYQKGPKPGINPDTKKPYLTTKWDVLQFIDAPQMRAVTNRSYRPKAGPADRRRRLDYRRRPHLHPRRRDVELWHRGQKILARSDLNDLDRVI